MINKIDKWDEMGGSGDMNDFHFLMAHSRESTCALKRWLTLGLNTVCPGLPQSTTLGEGLWSIIC